MGHAQASAVALDYTALLTTWALFGDDLLARLRAASDAVYLPARLLAVLDWDQETLATHGQPARDDARAAVERSVTRHPQRLHLHPSPAPDAAALHPIAAAGVMSAEAQLTYLTAYPSPQPPLVVAAVDLLALGEVLLRAGEIGPREARLLRQHVPLAPDQPAPVLARGSDIATNTLTLVALTEAGALDGLLGYISGLHLLERDWEELRAEIAAADLRAQALRDLDRLRAEIRRGIEEGLIHVEVLAPEQHLLGSYALLESEQAEELPPVRVLAAAYTDELISLAVMRQAVLWTDDRWTGMAALPEPLAIERVSTETMLDWLHHRGMLDDEACFSAHGRMVEWGYQGLTVHPGYLRWLLGQGVGPDAPLLITAAARYHTSLLAIWAMMGPATAVCQQLFGNTLLRTAEMVVGSFADGAAAEVVSMIVRDLDVSRSWPDLEGNEPASLSDLLVRIVG